MAEEQAAAQGEAAQQQFVTQRIYTKDISFESPMAPEVFRREWKPAVNVDLNTKSSRFDEEGNHEVVLTLTITAKLEDQTAFLVEVQQAGIFFVAGIEGDALRQFWPPLRRQFYFRMPEKPSTIWSLREAFLP